MNYARWGCVYLSEMHQLPAEVEEEFSKGNFVVKGSEQSFNQVDPDHSLEWLNGIGKKEWRNHRDNQNEFGIGKADAVVQPENTYLSAGV